MSSGSDLCDTSEHRPVLRAFLRKWLPGLPFCPCSWTAWCGGWVPGLRRQLVTLNPGCEPSKTTPSTGIQALGACVYVCVRVCLCVLDLVTRFQCIEGARVFLRFWRMATSSLLALPGPGSPTIPGFDGSRGGLRLYLASQPESLQCKDHTLGKGAQVTSRGNRPDLPRVLTQWTLTGRT